MSNTVKTAFHQGFLSGFLLMLDESFGGPTELMVAFVFVISMNRGSSWFPRCIGPQPHW